jgi:hypothetical protein
MEGSRKRKRKSLARICLAGSAALAPIIFLSRSETLGAIALIATLLGLAVYYDYKSDQRWVNKQ